MPPRGLRCLALAALAAVLLPGCTVITVAGTVTSVAVGTVGLAADAAIGTVRITGKVVGATADAVIPAPAAR